MSVGLHPFSRPIQVDRLPQLGLETRITAAPEERDALARDFGLPGIDRLEAQFRVTGSGRRVHVSGRVEADLRQTCVVTLEDFDVHLQEPIEIDFADEPVRPEGDVSLGDADPPDQIVNGRIDLGALAAEFLALSLDPHPRKPGARFDEEGTRDPATSPFAALGKLKGGS